MTSSSAAGSAPQGSGPRRVSHPEQRGTFSPRENLLPVFVLIAGLIARIVPASRLFLDPDEALHNLLASQATVGRAWAAALTNAHPPLLIIVLYFWRGLGQSELWLRLPSVLAG